MHAVMLQRTAPWMGFQKSHNNLANIYMIWNRSYIHSCKQVCYSVRPLINNELAYTKTINRYFLSFTINTSSLNYHSESLIEQVDLAICIVEEMTVSKAFTLCILALLICSLCTETTNAGRIGNGALKYDLPICRGGKNCSSPPSNRYSRGCEKERRCRGGKIYTRLN